MSPSLQGVLGGGAGADEQSLSLSSRDDGMRGTWG